MNERTSTAASAATDRRAVGPGRRRTTAQLHALASQASSRLEDAPAPEVLAWAAQTFGDRLAVACSMAADTVLADLVACFAPGVDVLFLQTGYHFPQTLATRDALAQSSDVRIVELVPRLTVAEQDVAYGKDLFARDPGACCGIRKVEPLDNALAGYEAWVTGVRREDSALRADARLVEWDAARQMVKINPLAAWSFDDVLSYAEDHLVPVNPLLGEGYPSIGCQPCTRQVAPGEDPRAGRWAGLAKTECGIHL